MEMEMVAWLKSVGDMVIRARNSAGSFSKMGCNGIPNSLTAFGDGAARTGFGCGSGCGTSVEIAVANGRVSGCSTGSLSSKCRSNPRSNPANFVFMVTVFDILLMFCFLTFNPQRHVAITFSRKCAMTAVGAFKFFRRYQPCLTVALCVGRVVPMLDWLSRKHWKKCVLMTHSDGMPLALESSAGRHAVLSLCSGGNGVSGSGVGRNGSAP